MLGSFLTDVKADKGVPKNVHCHVWLGLYLIWLPNKLYLMVGRMAGLPEYKTKPGSLGLG